MKRVNLLLTALLAASLALGGAFLSPADRNTAMALDAPVLSDTYQAETSLIDPPTVVSDVRSGKTLQTIKSSLTGERPGSAILHINAEKNVVDSDGNVIGGIRETVQAIRAFVIPVLAVSTREEAEAAVSYFNEEPSLIDAAVFSEDPALVAYVRSECDYLRGVVCLRGMSPYMCVKTASLNGAGTVVLDSEAATYETISYIQARFKSVWVISLDEFDDYAAITGGAYGIVTEDFSATYSAIKSFSSPVHARMPFNVAHRGLPSTHNENSVNGTRAAIEAGATHVELDGKLTTDGEIVMMHDDNIERTAEGAGNIESMSLAEAKTHLLDLHAPKEEIPTLGEIIPLFENSDAVLVFEIKTKNTALIARLKEILDEENFYEHIVVIAFDYPNLEEMRRLLPEVPTADLNSYSENNFAQKLPTLGKYGCAISTSGSSTKEFNEKYLRDRGIIGWYWTQQTESAVDAAFEKGLMGLTNNVGAYFGAKNDIYRVVLGDWRVGMEPPAVGASIPVQAVKYDGTVVEATGEVFLVEKGKVSNDPRDGGYYDVIAKYISGDMTYYTPAFRFSQDDGNEKRGCAGTICLSASVTAAAILLPAVLILCIRKRKHD